MSDAIVFTRENPWLNEATFIPRLQNIQDTLRKWESVMSMLWVIRELDKRAVVLFEIRNGKLPQKGKSHTKYSILNPEIQKLVYSYKSTSKDNSPILIGALKQIWTIMVQEVQKFLKQWDIEESGEKQAIILWLVQEWEKKYDEAMELLQAHTFQPIENDVFREKMIQLWHFISQHSHQETEELILRLGSLSGKQTNIEKWLEWTQEKVSQILRWIENGYSSFKKWDRWLNSKNKDGTINEDGIRVLRLLGGILMLQQSYVHWNDYIDGQWGGIEDLIAYESQDFWAWEGERKKSIIEEKVFPELAWHLNYLNKKGDSIEYWAWNNRIFFIWDDCVSIDLSWNGSNTTIWETTYKDIQAFDQNTGKEITRTEEHFQCDLPVSYLTEIWVGNNMDFFLNFINHPESIREIRRLSETLFVDWVQKD